MKEADVVRDEVLVNEDLHLYYNSENDSEELDENYLPVEVAEFVNDTSSRININPEIISMSLIVTFSAMINNYVSICPRQFDESLLYPATIRAVCFCELPLSSDKVDFFLYLLFHNLDDDSRIVANQISIERTREIKSGKIKYVGKGEEGFLQHIYSEENESILNKIDSEQHCFFASVHIDDIHNIVQKRGGLGKIMSFLLIYSERWEWIPYDVQLNAELLKRIQKIFSWVKNNLYDREDKIILKYTPEAQEVANNYLTELNESIQFSFPNSSNVKKIERSYKEIFFSYLPALAANLYLIEIATRNKNLTAHNRINKQSVLRAIKWLEKIMLGTQAIFERLAATDHIQALILEKITENKLSQPFSLSNLNRPKWSGLTDSEQNNRALSAMIKNGELNKKVFPPDSKGGPAKTLYYLPSYPEPIDARGTPNEDF